MTATKVRIGRLKAWEGERVQVEGWVVSLRKGGKIRFLILRDGSGILQAVLRRFEVDPRAWEISTALGQESSVVVAGRVRVEPRAPGGVELEVATIAPVQVAEGYPITPKEHGVDFLMDHRHLWLRSRRQEAILRIRSDIELGLQVELDRMGFLRVDSPILTPSACEGTTTLFQTDYFDTQAYLSQSGQLYNEATAAALKRVYCFGPTFRAEKSKTRRHLTEFWMLEPEMAFATLEDVMAVEEELITALIRRILENRREDLLMLGRDTARLAAVRPPFPRISYDEALALLAGKGMTVPWGEDLGSPQETALAEAFEQPVFIHRYPTEAKAFYMQPDPGRPEVSLSVDLLAPEGYGEIAGGGERIHDEELLRRRLAERGLPEEPYRWYLDLRKWGTQPHSGFGLGIERTLAWIAGLEHVRETIPFPRLLSRIYP